mgnify:FL=1|tara:strand:- start:401 stop:904 length:504 start_codon:yes stop_codon:yes gene_type:complete
MKLSKNFSLYEFEKSTTSLRLGISNKIPKEGVLKYRLMTTALLQPIRDRIFGSIRVTSGYRSPELNKAIGGSSNSQHCKCEAVDLQCIKRGQMDNLKIYNAVIEGALEFDQMILEFGEGATREKDSNNPAWVHISWKVTDNRRQILVAYKDENNKTKYRPPINYYSV